MREIKAQSGTGDIIMKTYPNTQLTMKRSEVSLFVEESRGDLRHVHVRVMNCKSTSVGHPIIKKIIMRHICKGGERIIISERRCYSSMYAIQKRTVHQRRRGGVLLTMKSRVTTRVPERCQASPGACRGRICYSSLPLTCCLVERLAPGGGRSPLLCVVLIAAAVKKVCIITCVFTH